jgi:hypothetical protein
MLGPIPQNMAFSTQVDIPSGPTALWMLSPASCFISPLVPVLIMMLYMVVYSGILKMSLRVEESSDVLNTGENSSWSFRMFAFVFGSEYARPLLTFKDVTLVLSVLLLVIKLRNFLGFD